MRAVRAAAAVVVLGLLGLLVWDVAHGSGGGIASKVDHGQVVAAPKLQLPFIKQPGTFDLASYRGKVVVLNFWASWCVDCKLEAKALHDAAENAGKDVVFIGVDDTDLSSAAQAFMKRYAINYPVVHDVSGDAKSTWGVTGFPETFFVDRSGRVTRHVIGPMRPSELKGYLTKELQS
ncbi:MAG TPA: TlpA disulfide reductase family protein [Gaiellaceae bacterium]|jgi:cytochrome c biogenesis protein CcmG/thiol:disulfide interchange protein DsbE|nr:TlpA disulfide reductase family protein [Gaiellaceae bacterium]